MAFLFPVAACLLFGFLDAVAIVCKGLYSWHGEVPVSGNRVITVCINGLLLAGFIGKAVAKADRAPLM